MIPFERKLSARIYEEITRQRQLMEAPMGMGSFDQYKYHLGIIAALKLVVSEYFDDVNKELNQEEE